MKRLEEFDVYDLPVADIYYDPDFNCRAKFLLGSVQELADSIALNGLQFPITVQPWVQGDYQWRLVCGHRRFVAVSTVLKRERIACCIRRNLTEQQARILNLLENLERKDLNILEEARALRRIYPDGISLRAASKELKRPTRWVHARLRLLELPPEVQHLAASGIISATNIETIHTLPTEKERIAAAREIVRQKRAGPKKRLTKYSRAFQYRKSKAEISRMIEYLWNHGLDGLPTRLLAWAQGAISDREIKDEIKAAANR